MKDNGQDERMKFGLTDEEKRFVAHSHGRHLPCEPAKCNVHFMVHLIIRLEAGLHKMEHDLRAINENEMGTHGEHGLCDRCAWSNEDWLTNMASEWRHP